MRSILRAILAIALLLGGGVGDWAPVASEAHEACCCGTPAGMEDSCPCPKPEGNRTPLRGACSERQFVAAQASKRASQGERRTEPRPEPAAWARTAAADEDANTGPARAKGARDPDLGRHLAHLSTFRI